MAISIAVGADDTPFGASPPYTETYTHSLGVEPDLILFYCSRITATSSHDTDGVEALVTQSMGFAIGTAAADNVGLTTDCNQFGSGGNLDTSAGSVLGSNLGSAVVVGAVDTIGTTTFRVNYTSVEEFNPYHLHWCAIAGISEAALANSTSPTSVSTQDVAHGLSGGAPDAVICLGPTQQSGTSSNNQYFNVGAWDGSSHACTGFFSNYTGGAYDSSNWQNQTNVLEKRDGAATLQLAAHINSADGTNIEFDFTTVEGTARPFLVLSLRGVQADAVTDTQKTSTGTQDTTCAFTPEFVLLTSWDKTSTGASVDHRTSIGYGASSTLHLHSWSGSLDAGTDNGDGESQCTGSKILQMCSVGDNTATTSTDAEANLDATTPFPSNAFRLDWTTADATARAFNALALAEMAGPANAEERRAAAAVMGPPFIPGVTPTVGKDVEWRQQSAWSYSGIAPDSTAAGLGIPLAMHHYKMLRTS